MMKKILSLFLFLMFLFGCDQFNELKKPENVRSLLIAGASGFLPLTNELVEAFQKQHEEIFIVTSDGGSAAGMLALNREVIDIAAILRPLQKEERQDGVLAITIGYNAIALVINAENKVRKLTKKQASDVLTGQIKNWDKVKGVSDPIEVVARTAKSTTLVVIKVVLTDGDDIVSDVELADTAQSLIAKVAENPRRIGFVSLADWQKTPESVRGKVALLSIDDVAISEESVISGAYPLSQRLSYVVKEPINKEAKQYIEFVLSSDGQNTVRKFGMIPVR